MIKNYKDMLHIVSTNNKNEQIVDARPPNQFNGKFFLYHFFSN
jgi:3-mercaptopyruvate sulfurtransferase SseA